jgi:hypothetical protein
MVNSVVVSFLLFSDEGTDITVNKTNHYAVSCIFSCNLKPKSRMHSWRDVTGDDMYVIFGLPMLIGSPCGDRGKE